MPFLPTAFHRLLEPLDRRIVDRVVDRHNGNHGVGSRAGAWTCQRHLKAMLFAQFAGLNSLREIEQALAARPGALYHLGLRPPRRSTLSDASAARPAAVFHDLCQHLMATMAPKLRRQGEALIELLDASPIALTDSRFTWAEADARTRGLKLYVHYDPIAVTPTHFAITSPKTSDIACARPVTLAAGTTYVFDKGFTDYSWWHDITKAEAFFVTRLKKNALRRDVAPRPRDTQNTTQHETVILDDATCKIGHKKPRGGAENPLYDTILREVTVAREGKEPLHLVTNDLKRSACEIADLYKQRWQIELFFKWIKQNLKIKSFLGRSENAVKIQIYVALIAFMLLRMLKDKHAKSHKGSIKTLLARLKVALLSPIDLTNRAKPPPTLPKLRPRKPQIEFNLI